ncbi:MAG TPA: heavy metal-binding domain-containing protein [Miltoncostaeaceae bacterium]|nr:heavy metal-binding domain-containing protein [Miltoncostaeaceae bacterium]
MLRWNQAGAVPIPRSSDPRRLAENRGAGSAATPASPWRCDARDRLGSHRTAPQGAADADHHGRRPAGYEITEVLVETFGLTVRSRHVGSQIGAGFKSIVGGELRGMTKMLAEGREQAIERLVEEAEEKGANAIVAMRFDTSEFMDNATEICAYGTAVTAAKR